mgnify:CR=1 FL=1
MCNFVVSVGRSALQGVAAGVIVALAVKASNKIVSSINAKLESK